MTFYVGGTVRLTCAITNTSGTATNPAALQVTVTDPAGDDTTYTYADDEIVRASTGNYYLEVTPDAAGWWKAVWASTTPTALDVQQVYVEAAP
jgi:hypothetical protein